MTDNPNGSADDIGLIGLSTDDRIDRIDKIIRSNLVYFILFFFKKKKAYLFFFRTDLDLDRIRLERLEQLGFQKVSINFFVFRLRNVTNVPFASFL